MAGPLLSSGSCLVLLLKSYYSSILLRKVPDGILPWSSVRPISVAATLYRTWAKMRTQQLLDNARTLSTATVQPCLSTRSIWGIQVELTAEFLKQHISPCGVVLDLIKAFNVVCRAFLRALMLRLGFPPVVINAWFASMHGLCRQPLVATAVHGSAISSTGIPEGDPLSILGTSGSIRLPLWLWNRMATRLSSQLFYKVKHHSSVARPINLVSTPEPFAVPTPHLHTLLDGASPGQPASLAALSSKSSGLAHSPRKAGALAATRMPANLLGHLCNCPASYTVRLPCFREEIHRQALDVCCCLAPEHDTSHG